MAHKHPKSQTYIDPELGAALKAAASKRRWSKTKMLEHAVRSWLDEHEPGLIDECKTKMEEEHEEEERATHPKRHG